MHEYCFSDSCTLEVRDNHQLPAGSIDRCKSLPQFFQRLEFFGLFGTAYTNERWLLHVWRRVILSLILKILGFLVERGRGMGFERSLRILLLGPIVARALIYGKGGNVW